jgi:hypothetical protein
MDEAVVERKFEACQMIEDNYPKYVVSLYQLKNGRYYKK